MFNGNNTSSNNTATDIIPDDKEKIECQHVEVEEIIWVKNPTCTESGSYKIRTTCSKCGMVLNETGEKQSPRTEHDYVEHESHGVLYGICANCGDTIYMQSQYPYLSFYLVEDQSGYAVEFDSSDYEDESGVITIPETYRGKPVKEIRHYAFDNCELIKEVNLPSSIEVIRDSAFDDCIYLERVNFSEGLLKIESDAFNNCQSLKEIILPDSLQEIEYDSFESCPRVKEIKIGSGLETISSSFSGCTDLRKLTISEGVKNIGSYAFRGLENLNEVSIPSTIERIGYRAFYGCTSLPLATYQGAKYLGDYVLMSNDNSESLVLKDTCRVIYPEAFKEDNTIRTVDATSSNLIFIGDEAFNGTLLNSLLVPTSFKYSNNSFLPTTFNGYYIDGNGGRYLGNNSNNYYYLFGTTPDISEFSVNPNCEVIGSNALSKLALENITIPDNVKVIDYLAFAVNEDVRTVALPSQLEYLGEYAFSGCSNLESVTINSSKLTKLGKYTFYYCESLTEVNLPNSITELGEGCFEYCTSLTSTPFLSHITKIGESAFEYCTALTSVTLADNTELGEKAFYNCTVLESVTIGEGTTIIPTGCFYYCEALTEVNLPDSIEVIEYAAFEECGDITITVGENIKYIHNYAFGSTKAIVNYYGSLENWLELGEYAWCEIHFFDEDTNEEITEIVLPDGVYNFGSGVFAGATNIRSIVFSKDLIDLGTYICYGCSSLEEITIYNYRNSYSYGSFLFYDCPKLATVNFEGTKDQWNDTFGGDERHGMLFNNTKPITVHCSDGDITVAAR